MEADDAQVKLERIAEPQLAEAISLASIINAIEKLSDCERQNLWEWIADEGEWCPSCGRGRPCFVHEVQQEQ